MSDLFPTLPDDWEATRATLHAYAHGVGAIARVHGIAHPKWWHISLKVNPGGLRTESIPLPDGGTVDLRMDLRHHHVVLEASSGDSTTISMTEGLTGTEFGDRVAAAASALGLAGDYDRAKFENDEPRDYSPAAAETFFDALVNVETTMQRHRATLGSNVGPIQVWPHGFDLAFEWYGTRVEVHEEEGEKNEIPSQLNFGFYPAGRAYFYSNPWPFEKDALMEVPLPSGAKWTTEGFEGSILYYDQLAGDPEAADKLLAYAKAVHDAAAPTLRA